MEIIIWGLRSELGSVKRISGEGKNYFYYEIRRDVFYTNKMMNSALFKLITEKKIPADISQKLKNLVYERRLKCLVDRTKNVDPGNTVGFFILIDQT